MKKRNGIELINNICYNSYRGDDGMNRSLCFNNFPMNKFYAYCFECNLVEG